MESRPDKHDVLLGLKAIASLITATAAVVACVCLFFFDRMSSLKDAQIALLERQNAALRDYGSVPEAVTRLEDRLIPLTLAFPMDAFDGRVRVRSGMESPTRVTDLIIDADSLRKKKKFDLAAARLAEIDSIYPSFRGTPYFKFLIEQDKGNSKEALSYAEKAIQSLSEDARILPAYEFAIKLNLENGQKKRAEDFCLTAIKLDPENERKMERVLRDFFWLQANDWRGQRIVSGHWSQPGKRKRCGLS